MIWTQPKRLIAICSSAADLNLRENYGPFYYPPFLRLAFCAAGSIYISYRGDDLDRLWMVCLPQPRCWSVVCSPIGIGEIGRAAPAIMIVSMPFMQVVGHGQNTFLSLLLASLVVTAWRARRGLLAGLAAGLLFYKPQLAAVIVGVLVLNLGWRALAGAGISLGALLLITILTLPRRARRLLSSSGPKRRGDAGVSSERLATPRNYQSVLGSFADGADGKSARRIGPPGWQSFVACPWWADWLGAFG